MLYVPIPFNNETLYYITCILILSECMEDLDYRYNIYLKSMNPGFIIRMIYVMIRSKYESEGTNSYLGFCGI